MNGAMYDINTGKKIADIPDPGMAFEVYIDKTRERLGEENHLRYGRCRLRESRAFIDKMKSKGIECVLDKRLGFDACILVDGTDADWKREGLAP